MNLSKRELELQEMRISGRKAKMKRLSGAIKLLQESLDQLYDKPKKGKQHGGRLHRRRNSKTP